MLALDGFVLNLLRAIGAFLHSTMICPIARLPNRKEARRTSSPRFEKPGLSERNGGKNRARAAMGSSHLSCFLILRDRVVLFQSFKDFGSELYGIDLGIMVPDYFTRR